MHGAHPMILLDWTSRVRLGKLGQQLFQFICVSGRGGQVGLTHRVLCGSAPTLQRGAPAEQIDGGGPRYGQTASGPRDITVPYRRVVLAESLK